MTSYGLLEALVASVSTEEALEAVDTLVKITQNAIDNPHEERFKQIRIANKSFSKRVWRHAPAREFMVSTGWTLVDDVLVLVSDLQLQQVLIDLTMVESSLESVSACVETGTPGKSRKEEDPTSVQEKERLERMQKLKEMQRKVKEEKTRVSQQVEADRREMSEREAKPSHGRQLAFGANLNRFEDIGVDLNSGGG